MTARSHPEIPTLEIYTDEGQVAGQNLRLPAQSTRYQHLERCVHLALRILETPEGREALAKTATNIVTAHRQKKKPTLYQGNFSDMPKWISFFLTKVRSNFPMLYLAHTKAEAVCVRQANDIKKLEDFSPKHIGYMDVNRYIVNNMITAAQKNDASNLTRFEFLLGISIAHEIVHLLTGFLAGEKANTLHTPPDTSAEGYGTRRRGEAGRFMEELLFGGQTEMWMNPQDPLGVLQAGTPYLLDNGLPKARARLINTAYINKFVKGGECFHSVKKFQYPRSSWLLSRPRLRIMATTSLDHFTTTKNHANEPIC